MVPIRTWGATELPPPRYPVGTRVVVARETPGVIVVACWQTAVRPWVRYLVETGDWEWQHVSERALTAGVGA